MRRAVGVVLATLAIAGCSTPGEPLEQPSVLAPSTPFTELYGFNGTILGASYPLPSSPGMNVGPAAKTETFAMPAGTERLVYIWTRLPDSTGSARVEVYAPDGHLAFTSDTDLACFATVGCVYETTQSSSGSFPVGDWTVEYQVMGRFSVRFIVQAPVA